MNQVPSQPLPADPNALRHRHEKSSCYWNYVSASWSCGQARIAQEPDAGVSRVRAGTPR